MRYAKINLFYQLDYMCKNVIEHFNLTFIYEKKTEEIEKFVYLNYQKTLVSLLKIKVEKFKKKERQIASKKKYHSSVAHFNFLRSICI